ADTIKHIPVAHKLNGFSFMVIDNSNFFLLCLGSVYINNIFEESRSIQKLKIERMIYLLFSNVQDISDKYFAIVCRRLNTVKCSFLVFSKIRNIGLQDLSPHFYTGKWGIQIMRYHTDH